MENTFQITHKGKRVYIDKCKACLGEITDYSVYPYCGEYCLDFSSSWNKVSRAAKFRTYDEYVGLGN